MRKLFIYLLLLIFPSSVLRAQYYFSNDRYYESPVLYEVGFKAGIMNALTDLGGKSGPGKGSVKDLRWANSRPCYGAYMMVTYNHAISGRIEGTSGSVVGYDSILKVYGDNSNGRYARNQSFKTQISELQIGIEVHPMILFNKAGEAPPKLSPYFVIGAGYFSFDRQGKLGNNWYALKPLHTEGQNFSEYPDRKEYDLHQYNLLGGLGLRMELGSMFNARIEFLDRKLFTDYLDDVSTNYIDPSLFYKYLNPSVATIADKLANRRKEINPADATLPGDPRGNPKKKDNYFTIEFKLGLVLGQTRR